MLYVFLKTISIAIVFYLSEYLGEDYFAYSDLSVYAHNSILKESPNWGFLVIIQSFGIFNMADIQSILTAILFNTTRDLLFILLAIRMVPYRALLLTVILMGLHPYLALYHLKFVSGVFHSFAVLLILFHINTAYFKCAWLISLAVILTICRNSSVFILAPYFIYLSLSTNNLKSKYIYAMASLTLVTLTILVSGDYLGVMLRGSQNYPFAMQYFTDIYTNFSSIINGALASLSYVLVRVLLLFGGREKFFTEGVEGILSTPLVITLAFCILLIIHIIGFFRISRGLYELYSVKSLSFWLPLVLSCLTVAHMRYLMPYIPLILLGFSLFVLKLPLCKETAN